MADETNKETTVVLTQDDLHYLTGLLISGYIAGKELPPKGLIGKLKVASYSMLTPEQKQKVQKIAGNFGFTAKEFEQP